MSALSPLAPGQRLAFIDLMRGLVIALMALDHVRDYFHADAFAFDPLDPAATTPLIYATRWITHLCAPTFIMLAGVSIWLQAEKGKTKGALSLFLLTRGLWLIALELTIIGFAWNFTLHMIFLQVIWAIGWSMIVLAALVHVPRQAVLAIGALIIVGGYAVGPLVAGAPFPLSLLTGITLVAQPGAPFLLAPYPILPWLGIMLFGYGIGPIFAAEARTRDRTLLLLGAGMIALFLTLRAFNIYGDPRPWSPQLTSLQTLMSFFDVVKNPPSLLYVCATLGPMLALTPLFARLTQSPAHILITFGAVPLFAYVLHIYVLHALAMITAAAQGRNPSYLVDFLIRGVSAPETIVGQGVSLPWVYVAWLVVLGMLYPLCRWWAHIKSTRRDWWLSYL